MSLIFRTCLWAFLTSCCFATPVLAESCIDPQTTLEMRLCASQDYEAADAELNAVYKEARAVMKALDQDLPENLKGAGEALLQAQRAWIPFRDKACESEGFLFRGGSFEPLTVLHCKTELTRQRSEQLRFLLEGL
ncbi:lysozyme inhibitor LprI family protein [Roseobacter sp. SK209-2-6]|uniref:lysozyme inhibitor LprI family protein n=1 Tax=Roseobacter sp. SK209-2-6 TaxID=388739 RepID=UPI000680127F|nr:lysozyme inhibitor LprI family protein [Roseobacter sp. SK209-2-6]